MDRAWIRLKDLAEDADADIEALRLAATLFLDRGWPTRARDPLERALADAPDDSRLQTLWDRLDEAPVAPDEGLRDRVEDDDLSALLPLAETYVATGATLKARSVLESLKRHHPRNRRVDDLLWALDGDFGVSESLADLAARLGPDLTALAELADDAEHTESLPSGFVDRDPEEAEAGAFPALFRTVDSDDDDGEGEVTRAIGMATSDEMRGPGPDETTDVYEQHIPTNVPGDTQILRVISRDGPPRLQTNDGPIHRSTPTAPAHPFDLGEYRRQMGMGSDLDLDLEHEDDDVIVLTGRERSDDDDRETTDDQGITELLPDPTSSEVKVELTTKLKDLPTPEPRVRRAPSPDFTPPEVRAPTLPDDDIDIEITWRRRHSMTPWLVALAALLLMGGVVMAFALALIVS